MKIVDLVIKIVESVRIEAGVSEVSDEEMDRELSANCRRSTNWCASNVVDQDRYPLPFTIDDGLGWGDEECVDEDCCEPTTNLIIGCQFYDNYIEIWAHTHFKSVSGVGYEDSVTSKRQIMLCYAQPGFSTILYNELYRLVRYFHG